MLSLRKTQLWSWADSVLRAHSAPAEELSLGPLTALTPGSSQALPWSCTGSAASANSCWHLYSCVHILTDERTHYVHTIKESNRSLQTNIQL